MAINYQNKKICFHKDLGKDWHREFEDLIIKKDERAIELDCGECKLNCYDIDYIKTLCIDKNIEIISLVSQNIKTIISASSLGLNTTLRLNKNINKNTAELAYSYKDIHNDKSTKFHKGTLRAGEVLETNNDLLVVGDVNPGAKVIAGGNIMIWGRLLGIAHAGSKGNTSASITALQLRPVQLRIAKKVARGPKEKPEEGFTEEALIEDDIIVIKPARTTK